jgi:hypothetical protein
MTVYANLQRGVAIWALLLLLSGMAGMLVYPWLGREVSSQASLHQTMAVLARAEQALLAYAQQPLGTTACELNCPRPGDLPCPDRNNDGIAETSCSNSARLGRLPWKTLGLGDLRDGSGERLWYAVSERYKNNPRFRPLNLDTQGSWSVETKNGPTWKASLGSGVVAVVIAPMQPLVRQDGWQQRRLQPSDVAKEYLDVEGALDNANPAEYSDHGFVMAPASAQFNDVVWPISSSRMHQAMQKQVLSELKRAFACTAKPCVALPAPAAMTDLTCLGAQSLQAGQCVSAQSTLGRLPVDQDLRGPLANQAMLDGQAMHHWFQQNGWREQVFYVPRSAQTVLVVSGETLPGQLRQAVAQKTEYANFIEMSTVTTLGLTGISAWYAASNDQLEQLAR